MSDIDEGHLTAADGEDPYVTIRRAILDGTLKPGQRIVEQQVAQRLNISRGPVREALFMLERDNLVARAGRGLSVRRYSADEVRDNYNLRAVLESYAARLAADRPDAAQLALLEQLEQRLDKERSKKDPDPRACARLNQQFHTVLVKMPRSPSLERCFVHALQLPLLFKAYLWYGPSDRLQSSESHLKLIELLRERRPEEAADHWRHHIEYGRDVLVARMMAAEVDI